jgi:predicted  nucleic acid-binding Zn-ribbon protein
MAFGGNKRVETLEAEVERLNQWVAHLGGTDAMTLAAEVDAARRELAAIKTQAADAAQAAAAARAEEQAARAQLADNLDEAVMHEAGLYTYSHRLDSAVVQVGAD